MSKHFKCDSCDYLTDRVDLTSITDGYGSRFRHSAKEIHLSKFKETGTHICDACLESKREDDETKIRDYT